MSLLSNNCKIDPNCQITIPIDDRSNIGHSLSAISLNFNNLDTTLCNITQSADNLWTPSSEEFLNFFPKWSEMLTVIENNSACWNETYNTVNTLSSFWLKPITLIYPYPFEKNAINTSDTVESWLNENFPTRVGECFNFIIGQELYVFTPMYTEINRFLTATQAVALNPIVTLGARSRPPNSPIAFRIPQQGGVVNNGLETTVTLRGSFYCIRSEFPFFVKINFAIDSSVQVLTQDKFIQTIVGLKFEINPDTYQWRFVEFLFNAN
jgi:hypothetical protein